ncbi:hypothetical protein HF673_12255 [Acidithiobacillus thiooxidans]|uniref:hypothetical protein n=2 Tax=Acidithiobacillus thiooxidans TaxID=930 RepID=UPI001C079AC1|nr:hypothetical protein [Acidithiobacillus thiooxidans]MBU2836521.1 hypothetical protein [Acidithiobacillus thiooxidans]
MRIKSNDGDRAISENDVGGQAIGPGAEGTDFAYPGFKDLFAELAAGNGKTLVRWLRSEAQRTKVQAQDLPKALNISEGDYQKLISGPEQSLTLSATVFAQVADWLQISIVGTLAAAGVGDFDARHDQHLKSQCIDFALDKIARHPVLGKLLPVEIYLAEERVRESFVRLYQEEMGTQLIPEEVDWDEILDAMIVLQVQSRAYRQQV